MTDTTSSNRQKKEVIVAELAQELKDAKAVVFANYQGMTHKQIEVFKKTLKASDADLIVTKNTLITIALGDQPLLEKLQGPTATLIARGDIVTPLKALAKSIKDLKLPVVKFGILDGKSINAAQVEKLSTLPTREALLGQLAGQLKTPLHGLHRALSWNMQQLVFTLKAIEQKKI